MRTRYLEIYSLVGLVLAATLAMATPLPNGVIPHDGRVAPSLVLSDSDGNQTDLKALRGQWVLVHFWASWCGPCREEMPAIQRLASQMHKQAGFRLVLVNTAETDDTVFEFLTVAAPDLVTLMDRQGQVTEVWQPRGLPASFLVDPEGRIRYQALGGRPWDTPPYVDFLKGLVKNGQK
ncbi:MAG: TlpA family protein disulfide reductase [Gammaproteobacteria bacterium]|nr:TlpA family protein disulfide reductase [Gammaproteobacteria bacterium]